MKFQPFQSYTIRGPQGIKLILDPKKIIPHDPGQDTPALVETRDGCGTYWCVLSTGEIEGNPLTESQIEWINGLEDSVGEWLGQSTKL